MFHEQHHRTFFKSVTWTVTAFVVTFAVLYLVEGDLFKATWHAVVVQMIKFVFFYVHERIWNISNYGQQLKVKGKIGEVRLNKKK
jgi:uncharacterized membrane protein